jgi:hypothetical protein
MSSPSDQANLAPVDVRGHTGWLRLIFNVFQQKNVNTVAKARGVAPAASLSTAQINLDQRGVSQNAIGTTRRGSMADVPAPQALIRQVTGIGDPARGR